MTAPETAALVDTLDAAVLATKAAWYAADEAWSAELARTYSDPGDARYDTARNAATPALTHLNRVRLVARDAFDATDRAGQALHEAFLPFQEVVR